MDGVLHGIYHNSPSPCKHLNMRNAERRSLLPDSVGGGSFSVVQNISSSSSGSVTLTVSIEGSSSSWLLTTVAHISSSSLTESIWVSPSLFGAMDDRNSDTIGALDNEPGASLRGRYSAYSRVSTPSTALHERGTIAHLDNKAFRRLAVSYISDPHHPIRSNGTHEAFKCQLTSAAHRVPRASIL